MKQIKLNYSRGTGFDTQFDDVRSLTMDDNAFAEGGFGRIYHMIGIDGHPASIPQVVKVFKNSSLEKNRHSWKTINKLQDKIIAEIQRCESRGQVFLDEYPALAALPNLVFEGELEGEIVRGYVQNNLKSFGMIDFEKVLNQDGPYFDSFIERDFTEKIQLCYQLSKGFRFLSQIGFIHADITPDNLFIHPSEPLCIIIDFDSGAVVDRLNENPSTIGKLSDWGAPEINIERSKDVTRSITINLMMDAWSVAVGLHSILAGCGPMCFLSELTERSLRSYSKHYRWPAMDVNDPDFNTGNEDYLDFLNSFWNTPELLPLRREFSYTFTDGLFNRIMRTSCDRWEALFSHMLNASQMKPAWACAKKIDSHFPAHFSQKNHVVNHEQELSDFINKTVLSLIKEVDIKPGGPANLSYAAQFMWKEAKRQGIDSTIKMMACRTDIDDERILAELEDFYFLLDNCAADRDITLFEYENLLYQAELALIQKSTVDQLLKSFYYKIPR